MKNKRPSIFNSVIVLTICAIIGYVSYTDLHATLNRIWEDVLCEDYTNRMNETDVKLIYTYSTSTSPIIDITDMQHTTYMRKHEINKSQMKRERLSLANQIYLLDKNPVKIERLDSLFNLRLKENNFNFETAASYYNFQNKRTLYSATDTSFTQTYVKLKKDTIDKNMIVLQSYVKLSVADYLLHGNVYYVLLITAMVGFWFYNKKKNQETEFSSQTKLENEIQEATLLDTSLNNSIVICLDKRKHVLTCADKTIPLAPKLFGLFYLLSQGDDYFQSYDALIENLWTDKENPDKKHLEQLAIRLRKNLADIAVLHIEAVRGSGYRIKAINGVKVSIEQIETKGE